MLSSGLYMCVCVRVKMGQGREKEKWDDLKEMPFGFGPMLNATFSGGVGRRRRLCLHNMCRKRSEANELRSHLRLEQVIDSQRSRAGGLARRRQNIDPDRQKPEKKITQLDSYVYDVKEFTKTNSKWIIGQKERIESSS